MPDSKTIDVVTENIEYALGEGGPDERPIPMKADASLSKEFDLLQQSLLARHRMIQQQIKGHREPRTGRPLTVYDVPEAAVIQAFWLLWCYTSYDLRRIREQYDAQMAECQQQIAELSATVAALNEMVAGQRKEAP